MCRIAVSVVILQAINYLLLASLHSSLFLSLPLFCCCSTTCWLLTNSMGHTQNNQNKTKYLNTNKTLWYHWGFKLKYSIPCYIVYNKTLYYYLVIIKLLNLKKISKCGFLVLFSLNKITLNNANLKTIKWIDKATIMNVLCKKWDWKAMCGLQN